MSHSYLLTAYRLMYVRLFDFVVVVVLLVNWSISADFQVSSKIYQTKG